MSKSVDLATWKFDHYSCHLSGDENHFVKLADIDGPGYMNHRLSIALNDDEKMTITAERDLWGTWITFQIGDEAFTVAQEDGTRSFLDALIAGLAKLKDLTDFETTYPDFTNHTDEST